MYICLIIMKRKLTSVYSLPSLRNRIPRGFHNTLVKPLLIHRNCEITNACFFSKDCRYLSYSAIDN